MLKVRFVKVGRYYEVWVNGTLWSEYTLFTFNGAIELTAALARMG